MPLTRDDPMYKLFAAFHEAKIENRDEMCDALQLCMEDGLLRAKDPIGVLLTTLLEDDPLHRTTRAVLEGNNNPPAAAAPAAAAHTNTPTPDEAVSRTMMGLLNAAYFQMVEAFGACDVATIEDSLKVIEAAIPVLRKSMCARP